MKRMGANMHNMGSSSMLADPAYQSGKLGFNNEPQAGISRRLKEYFHRTFNKQRRAAS